MEKFKGIFQKKEVTNLPSFDESKIESDEENEISKSDGEEEEIEGFNYSSRSVSTSSYSYGSLDNNGLRISALTLCQDIKIKELFIDDFDSQSYDEDQTNELFDIKKQTKNEKRKEKRDFIYLCKRAVYFNKIGKLEMAVCNYEKAYLRKQFSALTSFQQDWFYYSLASLYRRLTQYDTALIWIEKIQSPSDVIQFVVLKCLIQEVITIRNNKQQKDSVLDFDDAVQFPVINETNYQEKFSFPSPSADLLDSTFSSTKFSSAEFMQLDGLSFPLLSSIPPFLASYLPSIPKIVQLYVLGELYCIQEHFEEAHFLLTYLIQINYMLFCGRVLALRSYINFKLLRLESSLEDISIAFTSFPSSEFRILIKNILDSAASNTVLMRHPYLDYFLERITNFLNTLTFNELGCKLSKAILFKETTFEVVQSIDDNYNYEKVTIYNTGENDFKFRIYSKLSLKGDIVVTPSEGILKKNSEVTLEIKGKMFCTSHIHQFFDIQFIPRRQLIGENRFVRISFSKKYNKKTKYFSYDFEDFRCCFIICASSVLSSIIDYDEIKFSKLIAEGSFGKVYKANWRNSVVAVKILKFPTQMLKDEMLKRELVIMSKLKHANIVQFIGATQIEGQPFSILMEFVGGGSLKDLLRRQTLSENFRFKLAIDIARGMSFLHSNNIYHRDLKPDNILVVSSDPSANVNLKITDFGTSRTFSHSEVGMGTVEFASKKNNLKITKGVGTFAYACPEIIRGDSGYIIEKADVYSFGTVVWEIFTQKEPFGDEPYKSMNYFELVNLITKNYQLEIPSQVPYIIKQLILQCWHSIPEIRPPFNKITPLLSSVVSLNKASEISAKRLKILNKNLHFKLVILGDQASGKSTFIHTCVHQKFTSSTNLSLPWKDYESPSLSVTLRDTPPFDFWKGQDVFSSISWGEGFILVFNVTSPSSFLKIQYIFTQLISLIQRVPPIIVVATNVDLKRTVHPEEGRELAAKLKCPYVETSAKTCFGLEYAIHCIKERIYVLQLFEKGYISSIYKNSLGMIRDYLNQNENFLQDFKLQISNILLFESRILEVRDMKNLTYDSQTITISNTGSTDFRFEIRFKQNPKYELKIKPSSGKIKKESKIEIEFQIRVFCTSKLYQLVELCLRNEKDSRHTHSNLSQARIHLGLNIESELSSSLDFDEIELIEPIAENNFGRSYKAWWRNSDVEVQILENFPNSSSEYFQTIEREIGLLRFLSHQNVHQYMGSTYTIESQPLSIISELLNGIPYSTFFETNSISFEAKFSLAQDISSTMAFLHANNIYFHLFHPNRIIILSCDSEMVTFKLTGFGTSLLTIKNILKEESDNFLNSSPTHESSKKLEESPTLKRKTLSLEKKYLVYLAPELIGGKEVSSINLGKVDIYSFGIFLWELISNIQPHQHPCISDLNEWEIIEWFSKKNNRLPFNEETPKFFQEIITLCCNVELFKRPSSSTISFYFQEKKIT